MLKKTFNRFRYLFEKRSMVLMYHRIGNYTPDPWSLSVTAENFERQLQVLQAYYRVVPLQQLVDEYHSNKIVNKTVAITFDDGYLDNFTAAKPLLEKYRLPATFFIATASIERKEIFWWDELERLILFARHMPSTFRFKIEDEEIEVELGKETVYSDKLLQEYKSWKGEDTVPNKRCELYLKCWKKLNHVNPGLRRTILIQLEEKVGLVQRPRTFYSVMDEGQLKILADNKKYFTLGAHSVNHPMLGNQPFDVQNSEISGSKKWFSDRMVEANNYFAYPHGSYNELTTGILQDSGFEAAFTTQGHAISKTTDNFAMGRFQVPNQSNISFQKTISRWRRRP